MDPGSIVGLATSVLTVAVQLHTYVSAVKDAKEDIRRLSLELLALKGALDHFEACSQNDDRPSTSKPDVGGMIKMTHEIVASIKKELGNEASSRLGRAYKALTWPLKRPDVERFCTALERSKTWFMMVTMQDASDTTAAVYSEMQRLMSVIRDDIVERNIARKAAVTDATLRWLAPVNNQDEHFKASRERVPGTGVWFRDEAFEAWWARASETRPILWVTGKSGSGKTVLASSIIDEIKSRCGLQSDREDVAFHYCSLDNSASQQGGNVLGALLAQLARHKPEVVEMLQPLRTPAGGLVPVNSLNMFQLEDLLVFGIGLFDRFCAVVDALNETPAQHEIFTSILNICKRCDNFRVLITCTSPPLGELELVTKRTMVLDAVDRDITTYVTHRLVNEHCFRRLTPETRDAISVSITSGAHGTFRWAQLCLDRLGTLRTGRDIRNALNDMPSTLNETYVRILGRISRSDQQIAREALTWLCFSTFSLSATQLAEAAVIDESDRYLDDDCRLSDPTAIVDICRDLVEVKTKVTLAHDSIRSFLTGDWITTSPASYFALTPESAHRSIMRKCLTYLSFDEFAAGHEPSFEKFKARHRRWPLARYAATYWPIHANKCTFTPADEELILGLFATKSQPRGGAFESWVQLLLESSDIDTIRATEPLYYAASFEMVSVLKLLLRPGSGVNVNKAGGRYRSAPLVIACFRGNNHAALMLLEAGADPRVRDGGTGATAFALAQRRQMHDVVAKFQEVLDRTASKMPGAWSSERIHSEPRWHDDTFESLSPLVKQ